MEKCEFYDVEILDGYFSGVIYIYDNHKRYILNIGYDVEFEQIRLFNCENVLYNSSLEKYSPIEIGELTTKYYYELKLEVKEHISQHGDLVFKC